MPHTILFFVFPGFQILDLTGPLAAFEMANGQAGLPRYKVRVGSLEGGMIRSSGCVSVQTERYVGRLSTLMIAGGDGTRAAAICPATLEAVRGLAASSTRVASVCSGAFILAAAGLLAGRVVTTHWRVAASLQALFPALKVAADRIFVRDGPIWSSAGITAGIDLALALIAEYCGETASRDVARDLVVYYRRPGGQSQFSALSTLQGGSDRIARVLVAARADLTQPLSVDHMAAMAGMSPRQFARVFQSETGCTPAKAVERLRVEAARARIEHGSEKLDLIARNTGFSDAGRMRRAFIRITGHPPQAVRRQAG